MSKFPINGLQGIFEWLQEPLDRIRFEQRHMSVLLNKHQEVVYFIQQIDNQNGAIKIGVSFNPVKRLAQLQTTSPDKLDFIGVIRGGYQLETELHHKFSHLNLTGEWFRADDSLLEFIDTNAMPFDRYNELCVNEVVYLNQWYAALEAEQSGYVIKTWDWIRSLAIEVGVFKPESKHDD